MKSQNCNSVSGFYPIWRFRWITQAQISTASLFWGALNFNGLGHVRIARTSEVPGALKTKDLTKGSPKQNPSAWTPGKQTPQTRLLQHGLDVSHLQKWQQNPVPRQDYHQILTQTVDEGDWLQNFMKLVVPRRKGVTLWDAISQTSLLSQSFSFLHPQFSSAQLSWKAATLVQAWKKLSALYFYCLFFLMYTNYTSGWSFHLNYKVSTASCKEKKIHIQARTCPAEFKL